MLFVLIIIYGLLFRMKNKKVINIMESFSNEFPVNTNLTNIKKLNKNQLPTFLNGNWTSNTTNFLNNDTPTNLIQFKTKNLDSAKMIYKGITYKISNIDSNGLITTEKKYGNLYQFTPNFHNAEDMRLSHDLPPNVPTMKMISKGNDDSPATVIFKFMKGDLNPVAKEMVKYNQTQPNISGTFYSEPSLKNISLYKFRYDAITGIYKNYADLTNYEKEGINEIKEKYNNIISFQLLRIFMFSNNQYAYTPYSQIYNIKFMNNSNQVLVGLKFRSLKNELSENKLSNFYNIYTYLILQSVNKFEIGYDYSKPNIVFSKDELKLKNNASNYFEDWLNAPDLTSAEKTMNSTFKANIIWLYNNYNKNNIKESTEKENKLYNMMYYLKSLTR